MWFFSSLLASILWGLTYVLNGKMLERISITSALAIAAFSSSIIFGLYAIMKGTLKQDLAIIWQSPPLLLITVISTATFMIAEFLIAFSIQGKNATIASLIEITYPLFVAIFAYLIYKDVQITPLGIAGTIIIFIGIITVTISTQ